MRFFRSTGLTPARFRTGASGLQIRSRRKRRLASAAARKPGVLAEGPRLWKVLEESLGRLLRPLKRGPKPRLKTGDEGQAALTQTSTAS
jgi:hypothetical protein